MKSVSFNNFGYIEDELPSNLFNSIKNECENLNHKEMVSGLTGRGVAKHYYMRDNVKEFQSYLQTLILEYEKSFKYMNDIKIFSSPTPIMIDTPWINIQKKYEFIPNHTHDGVYSYTLWVKIPYDIEEELNNGHCHASTFEFTYNNITGSINNLRIPVSKEYEGKIIFFPAKLQHCVYPFYTSDENRISISGNIVFKT